jgi:serine/threonine protein kinase
LKIADFGLATSGEWIYQESYRSSRRKDLLRKYHKSIIDDGAEETAESSLNPPSHHTNPLIVNQEKLKKMHADSVVGTYYYMAPEVLQGESYNATADWYSHSTPN